jgi:hypothetical protein
VEPVRLLRYWWTLARWAVQRVGYWVRPYDMLADARRWFWQPRQRCGFAQGGVIQGPRDLGDDSVPAILSRGCQIVDPDQAEALGLTVEARRLRERAGKDDE